MATSNIEHNFDDVRKQLEIAIRKFPIQISNALKNAGNLTIRDLRKKTPKQSGNLARGYVIEQQNLLDYIVTNNVQTRNGDHFVSDLLENGTKAHGPKTAKVLAFPNFGRRPNRSLGIKGKKGTGKTIFTTFVRGIKAMHIFEKTVPEANKHVRGQILTTLERIAAAV
jgi:hypothetical protein